jgi:ribosomal protein L11 methyltransferase
VRAYSAYHFTIFPIEKTEIVSAWLTTFPFESYVEHDNGVTAYIPQDEAQKITLSDCLAIPFDDVTVSGSVEEIAGRNWNTVWEAQKRLKNLSLTPKCLLERGITPLRN